MALLVAGCGDDGASSGGKSGGTTKLTVQETAGVPSTFVAFGIEKGMFTKQKLEIDLEPTQGGAATIPALISGDIQVGGSNVVSLLLASAKDLPIRAIAGGTSAQAAGEKDFGALLVAKGQGISSPRTSRARPSRSTRSTTSPRSWSRRRSRSRASTRTR